MSSRGSLRTAGGDSCAMTLHLHTHTPAQYLLAGTIVQQHQTASIHFVHLLVSHLGSAGACRSCQWARGGAHPGYVVRLSRVYTKLNNYYQSARVQVC